MSRPALLALALLGACSSPPAEAPPVDAPAPRAASAAPHSETTIGVEGAWTFEIRDPDGTVVERRAVHNAYVDSSNDLARVLGGERTAGAWTIALQGNPIADGICDDGSDTILLCLITTRSDTSAGHVFPLDFTVGTNALTLEGGATAMRDGEVGIVNTQFHTCPPTTAPADCEEDGDISLFTSTTLDTPIDMLENQSIYVTVEISFATLP